jgi:hypothetical protein
MDVYRFLHQKKYLLRCFFPADPILPAALLSDIFFIAALSACAGFFSSERFAPPLSSSVARSSSVSHGTRLPLGRCSAPTLPLVLAQTSGPLLSLPQLTSHKLSARRGVPAHRGPPSSLSMAGFLCLALPSTSSSRDLSKPLSMVAPSSSSVYSHGAQLSPAPRIVYPSLFGLSKNAGRSDLTVELPRQRALSASSALIRITPRSSLYPCCVVGSWLPGSCRVCLGAAPVGRLGVKSPTRPGFWHVSPLAVTSSTASDLPFMMFTKCSTKSSNESYCHRLRQMEIVELARRCRRSPSSSTPSPKP